jgi:hypothetical protein
MNQLRTAYNSVNVGVIYNTKFNRNPLFYFAALLDVQVNPVECPTLRLTTYRMRIP